MKVRLTQISLTTGKGVFAIGETVEPNEEYGLTAEFLGELVNRGLAEPSAGDGVSAAVVSAVTAYQAAGVALRNAFVVLADLGEAALFDDAKAIVDCLRLGAPADWNPSVDRMTQLEIRVERELRDRQSDTPAAGSPVSAAGEAGSSMPASEGGPVDGREPPENSAGGDAGSTDVRPPQAGADGDAGASVPAEPEAQSTDAKKPARKGGRVEG